jgi:hypothetical protein
MKRALWFLAIGLMITAAAAAVEVDREELEDNITREVEFQNYEGPQEDVDTLEQILGIGTELARGGLEPGATGSYFDRYRVIHAVDPQEPVGLDADVFIILPNAEVNHIRNVRRILSAYLQAAFEYSSRDADTLARFVTVYNAIYRGDMEFFGARYKQVVLNHISAENAGISILYSDWPGATRMVVPLTPDAAPGELGAVDTLQLTDDEVTERLREEEDRAIEEREDMVDLMERESEQREERAEREREEIAEERDQIAEEEEALEEDREALEEERERTPPEDEEAQEELADREEELEEREEELEDRQEELEEREEDVRAEEERAEAVSEEAREQREEIAEDRREMLGEPEEEAAEQQPLPLLFMKVRYSDGEPVGQPVIIDRRTGDELRRSDIDAVTSRSFGRLDGDALVVADYEGLSRLLLIDEQTLEPVTTGEDRVYAQSSIVIRGRNEVYAVVEVDDGWRLGRFNGSLELEAYSSERVEPATYIEIVEEMIYVQNRTGTVIDLSIEELQED